MAVRENQSPTATAMTAITAAVILAACAASRAPLRVTRRGSWLLPVAQSGLDGHLQPFWRREPAGAVMPIYGKARGEG